MGGGGMGGEDRLKSNENEDERDTAYLDIENIFLY